MDLEKILKEIQKINRQNEEFSKKIKQLEIKESYRQREEIIKKQKNISRADMSVRTIYELETITESIMNKDFIEIGQVDRERKILISDLLNSFVGSVSAFPFNNVPSPFVLCDGRALDKNDYPILYARIGYKYGGSGDNFNVPSYNKDNLFLRASINAGTKQEDAMLKIEGTLTSASGLATSGTGAFYKTSGDGGRMNNDSNYRQNDIAYFDSSYSPGMKIGNEVRPKNISVVYGIFAL